ncbi:MAG: hypothetical protein K1X94_07960 [Sandaracinaceae bacterium]|nr:hypothetical protein [Sandaracinaceae bacterium]
MTIRTDGSSTRVTTHPMSSRTAAAPTERQFRTALRDGATLLLGGVETAARSLPGGEIVAAAIHGTASAASSSTGSGGGVGSAGSAGAASGTPYDALLSSSDESMQLIELQQQIQEENRRYSTLSNVLKARHETAKNAIGNIR